MNPLKLKSVRTFLSFVLLILASEESMAQYSHSARQKYAQRHQQRHQKYTGFNASFGLRSFRSASDYATINRSSVRLEGGQVGLVVGNSIIRSSIGVFGYYTSTSDIAGTIDLYQSNIALNFYPLNLVRSERSVIEPYIIGGLNYERMKLYGSYLDKDAGAQNFSTSDPPYLGNIRQFNATVGAGFDIKLLEEDNFVHVFTEAKHGYNFYNSESRAEFSNTKIDNHWIVNIGVRFGRID